MTTVSEIIIDAYRQSNLIGIGIAPTQLQETEGLRYLKRIVKGVFGFEAGDPLTPLRYTSNADTPEEDYLDKDTRLILQLTTPTEVKLHPFPEDGTRFAYTDAAGNTATNSLTILGNGNKINGASSVIVNTNGEAAEYMYREDTGNWQKYSALALFDTFPFPEEFDDFFILTLAFRLNPAYQRTLDPQSMEILNKQKGMLRARYSQTTNQFPELGIVRLSKLSAERDAWFPDVDSNFEI